MKDLIDRKELVYELKQKYIDVWSVPLIQRRYINGFNDGIDTALLAISTCSSDTQEKEE